MWLQVLEAANPSMSGTLDGIHLAATELYHLGKVRIDLCCSVTSPHTHLKPDACCLWRRLAVGQNSLCLCCTQPVEINGRAQQQHCCYSPGLRHCQIRSIGGGLGPPRTPCVHARACVECV
jgi:hypothetical protein